jgi:hypothetical protein
MEENKNNDRLEIFKILKKIRTIGDFEFSLMSREEKIEFLVAQMEKVEKTVPDMVEHVEYGFRRDRWQ